MTVQIVADTGEIMYSRPIRAEDVSELSGLIDCTLDDVEDVE